MYPPTHAAESYRQTLVESSTPVERLVLLYDAAIQSTSAARTAIERGDIPARRDAMARLLAIIDALQSSLDMAAGAGIAVDLDRLYGYITTRVTDAAFEQSVAPLDDVHKVLGPLREAWKLVAADTKLVRVS